ncbi:MAG: FecR domain-containing protein [Candidatus Omnitrophica bacterium]|nr:FecR domain-containing protein [Candidatus Omnitrophota bacterium]
MYLFRKLRVVVLLLFAIALPFLLYAGYLFFMNGRVFGAVGEIEVKKVGQEAWVKVPSGYTAGKGDVIKTAKGSDCSVILGPLSSSVVRIAEDSEVQISDKNASELKITYGKILATAVRPSKFSKLVVKTPCGTCGTRGTGWFVNVARTGETTVEVYEGRVKYGADDKQYGSDPYMIRSGDGVRTLGLKTTTPKGAAPADAGGPEYDTLGKEKYLPWNEWAKRSSGSLSDLIVLNQIAEARPAPYPAWQEGLCYASWSADGYRKVESEMSIRKAENDTDASWVNIITTWYQNDINTPEIRMKPDKSPSDESVEHILLSARKLGLHVMLSPFVDLESTEKDNWRAEIGFSDNESWDKWFASYENYILHYAAIAEKLHVDIYNIGTELSRPAIQRPDKWISLIGKVREVYKGRLVYTANWFEEYSEVAFWGYLDYAGISAYFPLSEKDSPSYPEIFSKWKDWCNDIEKWQKTHGKPVIFPETGYKSCKESAKKPWGYESEGPVDLKQQRDCYRALMETFFDKPWFYGVYWWVWKSTNPMIVGEFDKEYTPNEKPAAKLVKEWYGRPDPHAYKSWLAFLKEKVFPQGPSRP